VIREQDYDSDEAFDRKQNDYKYPWEHQGQDLPRHNAAVKQRFEGGSGAWERQGYKDNAQKFTGGVRNQLINKDHRHEYGRPQADVGHIFAETRGGSNTLGNVYMQEHHFNQKIGNSNDELNAAMVGYARTERALQDSRKFGDFDKKNPHAGKSSQAIVNEGKEEWKSVGVLTKKGGEVDKRSAAYKRGEIYQDGYGNMHGLADKADQIMRSKRDGKKKADVDELADLFGKSASVRR